VDCKLAKHATGRVFRIGLRLKLTCYRRRPHDHDITNQAPRRVRTQSQFAAKQRSRIFSSHHFILNGPPAIITEAALARFANANSTGLISGQKNNTAFPKRFDQFHQRRYVRHEDPIWRLFQPLNSCKSDTRPQSKFLLMPA
jgi:hypothetical protein